MIDLSEPNYRQLNDEWTIEEYNINCALHMMFKRRT